jgi:hypothetical protein
MHNAQRMMNNDKSSRAGVGFLDRGEEKRDNIRVYA